MTLSLGRLSRSGGDDAMPAINLTDDELAAVMVAIRGIIEDDRFPHAPRLDPLKAALGKFEAAPEPDKSSNLDDLKPKTTPAAKGKRSER